MFHRYLSILIVATALTGLGLVAVTASIDPYADRRFLLKLPGTPPLSGQQYGERKYKAALISGSPENSIKWGVFGNSRATAVDISAGIPGRPGQGINFAHGGADLTQMRVFINSAKRKHPSLVSIVGTNFDQCKSDLSGDFLYISDKTIWESRLDAFLRLASIDTLVFGFWAIVNPRGHSEVEIMPAAHNFRHLNATEAVIRSRIEADVGIYSQFFANQPPNLATCMDQLRLIRAQHPDAIFFLNPISSWMLGAIDRSGRTTERNKWLSLLKRVGPVLDFTCAHDITSKWTNYADAHNYRGFVGKHILEDISRFPDNRPLSMACLISKEP